MLQELLDRISEGGLNIHVIPVDLSTDTSDVDDPDGKQTIALLDELQFCEKVVRKLHSTMRDNDYPDKAEALKSWYLAKTKPSTEMMDTLTATKPEDRDEFLRLIREFNAAFEPLVAEVREKIKGITQRHVTAICEVDISDLLV